MGENIYSRDFHIDINIPQGVFETFMAAQTKLLGIKGRMEKTAKGYKGSLEGSKDKMEKLQGLIEKSEQFAKQITESVFAEIKEIKQYSNDGFAISK